MTDELTEPEKVDLETPDLAAASRAAFELQFPGVLADGVVDAERLKELLDVEVVGAADDRERYGLMWAGKKEAVRSLQTPSRGTLMPDFEASVDWDTAQNVFVEGDNLEVLKLLQKAYNDQVKLIYIDPPYNTGNDFVYRDNFSDSLRGYLEYTNQLDAEGVRVSSEYEQAGRKHSRWLTMMYPRLLLARNLLSADGILCISIDENESAQLRLILNDIFGEENYVNEITWVVNLTGRQIGGRGAARTSEKVLVYARDVSSIGEFRVDVDFAKRTMPSAYKGFARDIREDDRGPYAVGDTLWNHNRIFNEATRPNLVFSIFYSETTGEIKTGDVGAILPGFVEIPPHANNDGVHRYHAWRWSRGKVENEAHDLLVERRKKGYEVYTRIRGFSDTVVKDIITDVPNGLRETTKLFGGKKVFDYPKPTDLVRLLLQAGRVGDGEIVLDFFAGSGTTGHAVALENARDGRRRKCISVNIPEPTPAGTLAHDEGLATVSAICEQRLRLVLGTVDGAPAMGLRVQRLVASHFSDASFGDAEDLFDMRESTLDDGEHVMEHIAQEVLLKEGVRLDATWERHMASDAPVIIADGVAVVMCLDLTQEIADAALALEPKVVVFLEDGFTGADSVKANAFTNAKNASIVMKTV